MSKLKLKNNPTKRLGNLVSILVVAVIGLSVGTLVHAAGNGAQVYIAPSSGTYTVGDDVALQIRENGNGTAINGLQLGIKYPASLLQFKSIDGTGGAFTTNLSPGTQSSGEVVLSYANLTGSFTTDELIATVHFTALAAGSAPLTFTSTCQSESTPASDCSDLSSSGSSTATTLTGGTYTVQAAATTPPPTTTTTPPPAPTTTTSSTSKTSSSAATSKASSASITPQSSTTPIVAPDGSQVQVSTPATVEPATIQPDGVKVVLYFLNNKLVDTATSAPYSYSLPTQHLLNGTYNLTKKTYYTSGKITTDSYKVAVKNPISFEQFMLVLQHYAWLIILICVILILLIIRWILRANYPRGNNPLKQLVNKLGNPGSTAPPTNVVMPGMAVAQAPGSVIGPSGTTNIPTPPAAPPSNPQPSAQVITPTEIPVAPAPPTGPVDPTKT